MTVETTPPVTTSVEDDPFVMPPVTYSRIHVLAAEPVAGFDGTTYPSLDLNERGGETSYTDLRVTITGNRAKRVEFARQLRAVADSIEAWTPDV